MSLVGDAVLVARKDLRIELRGKVAIAQILPFGVLVVVLFAFAIEHTAREVLPTVAPGLFWVAVLLATLLAVGRSGAVETERGAGDMLRLSSLDPGGIFLGKAVAVTFELLALEAILLVAVFALYDVPVRNVGVLVLTAVAATVGLAATGTVYGVLAAGQRARETLVPLLVLPVSAPVLLGATRAFSAALADEPHKAWPWVQLLVVFAAVYLVAGILAYGSLLEDS